VAVQGHFVLGALPLALAATLTSAAMQIVYATAPSVLPPDSPGAVALEVLGFGRCVVLPWLAGARGRTAHAPEAMDGYGRFTSAGEAARLLIPDPLVLLATLAALWLRRRTVRAAVSQAGSRAHTSLWAGQDGGGSIGGGADKDSGSGRRAGGYACGPSAPYGRAVRCSCPGHLTCTRGSVP
jgi:hypothetical protein